VSRKAILVALLLCLSAAAFGQVIRDRPPPKELFYGVGSMLPPFSLGATGELVAFPWSIATDSGMSNQLGFGGLAGVHYAFGYSSVVVTLMGIFDGRFPLGERFSLDVETGLGLMMSHRAAFCGTIGVAPLYAINDEYTIRAVAAVDFTTNPGFDALDPDSPEFIIWFRFGVGLRHYLGTDPLLPGMREERR